MLIRKSGSVAAGSMWNGSSSRAVGRRTGYRRREPSQHTVAGLSVFELCTDESLHSVAYL